jgi:hypothetical protein
MSIREEITALQARIAKAQSERDTWQGSGMQEKYLEAYSLVEALEVQLERLRQEGLRTFAKNRASVGALLTRRPPSGSAAGSAPDAPGEPEPAIAGFSLAYSGRQYEHDGYRYDCLADTINSANPQCASAKASALPRPSAAPAAD